MMLYNKKSILQRKEKNGFKGSISTRARRRLVKEGGRIIQQQMGQRERGRGETGVILPILVR